jgi:hypothetical protein
MSKDAVFIDGVFIKKAPVDFFLIKGSICLEDLKEWVHGEGRPHVQKGNNGKHYINFDIKNGKDSGEPFLAVNTWKPDQNTEATAEANADVPTAVQETFPEATVTETDDDIPF